MTTLKIDTQNLDNILPDRVIPRCTVEDLTGSGERYITVQLPGTDGPRVLAYWDGVNPSLAVNDNVKIYRKGIDGEYFIFGTDAGTVASVATGAASKNCLHNSLTHDIFQRAHLSTDHADDSYFADRWNIVHNATTPNRPSLGRQLAASTDQMTAYMRIQSAAASTQMGCVQFLEAQDSRPLRGETVSLSLDAKGSNVTNIRAAILEWSSPGSPDVVTSDVVSTWSTGNPTLATNWTFSSTPSSSTAITSSWARYTFENITLGTSFNNLGVFIWTPDQEASGDQLDLARVQLEIGTASTSFMPRLAGDELALCQRYYNKSYTQGVVPGTASVIGVTERQTRTAIAASTAGNLRFPNNWVVTMRTTPTVVLYDYTAGTSNAVSNATAANIRTGCVAEVATNNDSSMAAITVDNTSANAIALDDLIVFHFTADAEL